MVEKADINDVRDLVNEILKKENDTYSVSGLIPGTLKLGVINPDDPRYPYNLAQITYNESYDKLIIKEDIEGKQDYNICILRPVLKMHRPVLERMARNLEKKFDQSIVYVRAGHNL